MSESTTTPSSTTIHQNVVPSEVGWQFVPQYYTFVNKQPHRLHCFYSKTSQFIHGTEGEDGKPSLGQQEIHKKILSIGFSDCKVFIHSVDAQSSANGGIIIQVIGEMSNKGEAWRKFVQTFFLAEQPNGYYVLNDIFRFLKEESVESEESEDTGAAEPVAESTPEPEVHLPPPQKVPTPPPAYPVHQEPVAPEPVATPEPAPVPLQEEQPAPPKQNGYHHHPDPEKEPEPVEQPALVDPVTAEPAPEAEPEPEVAPPVSTPSPAPPTAPSPAPPAQTPQQAPPPQPAQAPPPAPAPAAPPQPKTWANLAATNSKKWGTAVAQESRGTSEFVAPAPTPSSAPGSGTQTPVHQGQRQSHGPPRSSGDLPSLYQQAMSVTTPQVFVKGVLESVSNTNLTQHLTNKFGPIKEVEVVRSKACAFLEFVNLEHARRAIAVSLPQAQGGEGGIRIDVGAEQPVRIIVETRKERGDRPPPRPRGGAPNNGETRGTFRGRGGGRGRGGPPPAK